MKAQEFIHSRINDVARDFLNNQKPNEVVGFSYALGAGNAFNITIGAPGRVYAQNGELYEMEADALLNIAAADNDFPRLDVVVAVLEDEVDAETALLPFVRLRTNEELGVGALPYPPQNISAATEKHWRAVVQIRTGTASSSSPAMPALASNEVPLYLIAVAPGAAKLRDEDVLDMRDVIFTLRTLNDFIAQNKIETSNLTRRLERVENLASQPIDLSHVFGQIRSLGDILADLQTQLNAVRDLPEVRYSNPKLALTDPATAKIPAMGKLINGIPVVDIEIGARVNFGDREFFLSPRLFNTSGIGSNLNARLIHINTAPESVKKETALTLSNITQIASDGFVDFVEKTAEFSAARARPACAARNAQFVEIFGGLAVNNSSALSDWMTYDVDNDTLTPRVPSIALPSADRAAMMSYGDGTHVLLVCGNSSDQAPRCFKLNAATGAVTEILTTKPTGLQFFGDLISDDKIFLVAVRKEISGDETDFWEFNTATNTFTQLGVTGSVPACQIDYAAGCYYQQNNFVLVSFVPGVSSSGKTYIFNRDSLQWTEANIAPPYGKTAAIQAPLSRFRLANVNGRPLLVGGSLTKETDLENARVWELKVSAAPVTGVKALRWQSWNASFEPVQDCGFCSTLGEDGLPNGKAVFFGGQGKFSDAKKKIFASVQGGIIATNYFGEPAITIADSSTFAQFTVPIYNTDWNVAAYLINLTGSFKEDTLKAEVSFDGGTTFQTVTPNASLLVSNSSLSNSGERHLRITLYNLQSSKPILSKLTEFFDQDGVEIESRVVLRYNVPSTVNQTYALYIDRFGVITLEDGVTPSTPEKCLLHKLVTLSSSAPMVKNYINLRRPHSKYSKTRLSGLDSVGSQQFDNELAVPVRFVDARAYKADKTLYKLNDPAVAFDELVNVAGIATVGDTWIVELEG